MSVTGEFARYLAAAIDRCTHVDAESGRALLAALEDARQMGPDDLPVAAKRSLAALDLHLPSLEAEGTEAASLAAAAGRDLHAVGRVVLGR